MEDTQVVAPNLPRSPGANRCYWPRDAVGNERSRRWWGGQTASLVMIEKPEAVLLHQLVAFGELEIFAHHLADQIAE